MVSINQGEAQEIREKFQEIKAELEKVEQASKILKDAIRFTAFLLAMSHIFYLVVIAALLIFL
jgi:phage terminase large subunit-like protein